MRSLVLAAVTALAVLLAAGPAAAARWVLQPGQEALVGRMLGGDLPAGCRLLGAGIEKTRIAARFACDAGEARIEIRHPDDAQSPAARSMQLALVVPAGHAPPPDLLRALGLRLAAHDAAWRWTEEGRSLGRSLEEAGLDPRTRRLVAPAGAAAALGLVAIFAAALALARRIDAPASPAAPLARRDAIALALLGAAAFAFLTLGFPPAPAHADTARDLLMADECRSGLPCDHGPPTSLGVVVQGALWTRWLAACRGLGLRIGAVQACAFAMHALAAAALALEVRRRSPLAQALIAGALYATLSAFLLDVPILWNPSIAPLPLVAFHAALAALARARSFRSAPGEALLAAAAGGALALAIDCHVLFAVLVPALFLAAVGCARRPVIAAGASLAALAAALFVDSRAAWLVNARALREAGGVAPALAVIAVAVGCGALARRRLAALSAEGRAFACVSTGAAYTSAAALAIFAGFASASGRRYLMPAAPGLALGAAWIAVALARFAARAGRVPEARLQLAFGAAVVLAPRLGREPDAVAIGWTLEEVETVAERVYQRLPSYPAVLAHARARTPELIPSLAVFAPRGPLDRPTPGDDLVILSTPRGRVPSPAPHLDLLNLGPRVVVLATIRPFLDRRRLTFCFAARDTGAEPACVPAGDLGDPSTPEERVYPALADVRDAFPSERLRRMGRLRQTIRVAVRTSPGPAHRVSIARPACGYVIDRVTGIPARGPLPARSVVLEPGDAEGELTLAREDADDAPRPDRAWPPDLIEIQADDDDLARLLDDALTR